jgi:transmembrane sensor
MSTSPTSEALEVARAAAQWLALLESGAATEEDHRLLQQWRSSNGRHESTWQKAQHLRQRFAGVPSELAMATLDRPDLARRAALKRALGIAAVLPVGWLLTRQLPVAAWTADLHTATGERKEVALADGSSLLLNTDTAVNIDLAAGRLTLLRGEMALTVAARSTLTLASSYGQVIASHGEVCMRLNERDCRVSVVRGAVRVQPLSGAELLVVEGQQLSLQASGAGAIGSFDGAQPGWREGVLLAENQPLGDFLRELSRFRPGLLRWAPELEALRVTGSFQVDNTDRVLTLLAASLPVEVVSRTRYWVTLVPRKNIG